MCVLVKCLGLVKFILVLLLYNIFSVSSYHYCYHRKRIITLHCRKAHAKINGKIENTTPWKIVTHEDFNLKLDTRDYFADITHHATLVSNRRSGGFPQIVIVIVNSHPCDFFGYTVLFISGSCAQVEPSHWFLRWMAQITCFRPRKVLFGVKAMCDVISVKYSPKTP